METFRHWCDVVEFVAIRLTIAVLTIFTLCCVVRHEWTRLREDGGRKTKDD
jgi:hypothetical protein